MESQSGLRDCSQYLDGTGSPTIPPQYQFQFIPFKPRILHFPYQYVRTVEKNNNSLGNNYSDLEDGYGYNQGSALYELPGSTPAPRYELPANVPVELLVPPSAEPIHTACKLARQRSANPRARARRALSHQPASAGLIPVVEDMPMTTSAVGPRTSSQPAYSDGLIVAYADGIIPVSGSNGFIPVSCGSDGLIPAFGTEGLIPVPTPTPSPDHGLMTIDETTPNTPSCDFDSILRNIEPVGKAGRRKIRRERSSRYYDRYSSNFG